MALHPMPCSRNQLVEDHAIAKNGHEPTFGYGKPCFELLSYWERVWKPNRAKPTVLQGLHSLCTRCGPKGTISNQPTAQEAISRCYKSSQTFTKTYGYLERHNGNI